MKRYIRSDVEYKRYSSDYDYPEIGTVTEDGTFIGRIRGAEPTGVFSWNGWYYGMKSLRGKAHYYKAKTPRFDETFGGVYECSADEYDDCANKYHKLFREF